MKRRQCPYSEAGFTIVETLIVLAIAGLILLIVFLAIPALERNSRNNQRRQDVNVILQAVSRYELSNSGAFPQDCGGTSSNQCSITDTNPAYPNDYFLRFDKSKLTYYTSTGQVTLANQTAGATPPQTVDPDHVFIYNYQKCSSTPGQSTFQGAGFNDVVALFAVETSSGQSAQCQQL